MNKTVEHIPSKNLFTGYDDLYKKNILTVPACFDCNHLYSKVEQDIRDAIAIKNDSLTDKKELTKKGIKSIIRNNNWSERITLDKNGKLNTVTFKYENLKLIHLKNFKALFYNYYKIPMPNDLEYKIIFNENNLFNQQENILISYLMQNSIFSISGHKDIFEYIIKDLHIDNNENIFKECKNFEVADGILSILIYHRDIIALCIAGKKSFISDCKTQN